MRPTAAASPPDPLRAALEAAIGFQYRIERLLGRGGMGAVYLAHDVALDRRVAIKVLPPGLADDRRRERFKREARTAARLNHPGIVPLHTFGEVAGLLYFVMGYVEGESLDHVVRYSGPLHQEEALRVLAEVAEALDYAHRQGVVHRDIKPGNILMDGSGRPLLSDFGIARAAPDGSSALTGSQELVGTPLFMSPEQASGRGEVDARSDIYSLGVMGYLLVSGRPPFEGKTPAEVLLRHMTEDPPALRHVAPHTPPALAVAIRRCLAKDPANRWAHASDFAAAVKAVMHEGEDVPESLQPMESKGLYWLAGLSLAIVSIRSAMEGVLGGNGPDGIRPWLLSIVLGVALCVALLRERTREARAQGAGWREVAAVLFLQPRSWRSWYPRALARRSALALWARLPYEVRLYRIATLVLPLALAPGTLLVAGLVVLGTRDPGTWGWLVPPPVGGVRRFPPVLGPGLLVFSVITGAWLAIYFWARQRARRFDLAPHDLNRLLFSAPLSQRSFWEKPQVAAHLRPQVLAGGMTGMTSALPAPPDERATATRAETLRL